jgi:L-fuconolactonase
MIDSHVHFWRWAPAELPWIDEAMGVLRRDFLPSELEPLLAARGLEGCIAVQARQSLAETRFLLDLADAHASIRGVVGWVDLRAPDLGARLEELALHPRFKGVRHVAQDEPDDSFLTRRDVRRGIAMLESFDLVYDVLVYARQLPAAIELCRSLPNQPFVLDHLGKPPVRANQREPWTRHMRELAFTDNVACKLSGLLTEADPSFTRDDLAYWIDTVLGTFGPDRLLFGSDWPVCLLARDHATVFDLVHDLVDALAPDEHRAIFADNARRVYQLDVP